MRIIAHLDMDAFFASIEERDNSRFAGRPIVVGSDPGSKYDKALKLGVEILDEKKFLGFLR